MAILSRPSLLIASCLASACQLDSQFCLGYVLVRQIDRNTSAVLLAPFKLHCSRLVGEKYRYPCFRQRFIDEVL
eukprot:753064-Hanusia_phi.AAC.2